MPEPVRPSSLSEYAERTLAALAAADLGHVISVGGAIGLLHYLDYRKTDDVDAWWASTATSEDRERVLATVESTLRFFGEVQTRQWGEVVSLELKKGGKTVFSFQIASRSVQLQPPTTLSWIDVELDSLPDLVASKMVALVERGAPRDFRDIYVVCHAGLVSPADCWRLWRERQQRAGSDTDPSRARLAVETHLTRISQHRPLEAIADPAQRAEAEAVRSWFAQELLHAQLD
ncbi:MAG TPA: nucleotidyl transferase AbiEii/AbiGii toxin family protein [Thermoanaerobaculia bacterium]|nr:nucleotidyl transferase AbiEii/AbiGii toxin family protein [Thermoanaerobaculia bacterium]